MNIVIKKAYKGNGWVFLPGQRLEVDAAFGAALVAEGYAVSAETSNKGAKAKDPATVEFAVEERITNKKSINNGDIRRN